MNHAADFLEAADRHCQARGVRLTDTRRRVLELALAQSGVVKAYDVLAALQKERGQVAPPTVYRALDFLMAHGFVHRLETLNAYVPCPHPEAEAHGSQFLICEECQETLELDTSGIADRLRDQARQQGFQPRRHIVEVYGVCAKCRGTH